MATDTPPTANDRQTEHCDACDQLTGHRVTVEIRTESGDPDRAQKFSREPYRVAECLACGTEREQRMNNA